YDQYKAISSPLFYVVSMSIRVCFLLIAGIYLVGMADALMHIALTSCLCFCGSNVINHSFCDSPPLFLLSCSGIQINELVTLTNFSYTEMFTVSRVLVSYCYIILAILKIHSVEGR
ncbi:hypothetical protein M91_03857, partial [Bos mutus]